MKLAAVVAAGNAVPSAAALKTTLPGECGATAVAIDFCPQHCRRQA
jgi:hypothetical protein